MNGRTASLTVGGVVIVDDDPVVRTLLGEAFRCRGIRTRTFDDGATAWRVLREDPEVSMVLANWMLPGLDGHEICRRLAERGASACRVMMVGRSFLADVRSAPGFGATHLLAKPLRLAEIEQHVRRILTRTPRLQKTE